MQLIPGSLEGPSPRCGCILYWPDVAGVLVCDGGLNATCMTVDCVSVDVDNISSLKHMYTWYSTTPYSTMSLSKFFSKYNI